MQLDRDGLICAHLHVVRPLVLSRMGYLDEELISVGYYELVLAAAEFDPSRGVEFGIYARWKIAKRLIDHQRREQLRQHASLDDREIPDDRFDLKIEVQRAIDALPERQRLLLSLRYWRGLKIEEAAKEAKCSRSWAVKQNRAAIATLRERFRKSIGES